MTDFHFYREREVRWRGESARKAPSRFLLSRHISLSFASALIERGKTSLPKRVAAAAEVAARNPALRPGIGMRLLDSCLFTILSRFLVFFFFFSPFLGVVVMHSASS